jgi:hypothetical protein
MTRRRQDAIDRLHYVTENLLVAQDYLDAARDAFDFDTETEQWGIIDAAAEAIEKAQSTLRFYCVDCGKNTLGGEYYAVSDDLWAASGVAPDGGMLCLACLETRIGRALTLDDFTAIVPSEECWERHVALRSVLSK